MSPELREQLREAVSRSYRHDTRDPWELLWPHMPRGQSATMIANGATLLGHIISGPAVIGICHGWAGDFDPKQESRDMNLDGLDCVDYLDAYQFGQALRAEHTARWNGITPLRSPSTGLPYDSLALLAEMEKR